MTTPHPFDPRRLVQARQLACIGRRDLAAAIGEAPVTVMRWECGITAPRHYQLQRLAETLGQLPAFFRAGRPFAPLDSADVHICEVTR